LELSQDEALTRAGDDEAALAAGLSGKAHARPAADTAAALQAASLLQPMASLYPQAAPS
jgi:hypothetical protein